MDEDTRGALLDLVKGTGLFFLFVLGLAAIAWIFHGLELLGLSGAGGTHRFGG